jgi:hypothetical protein
VQHFICRFGVVSDIVTTWKHWCKMTVGVGQNARDEKSAHMEKEMTHWLGVWRDKLEGMESIKIRRGVGLEEINASKGNTALYSSLSSVLSELIGISSRLARSQQWRSSSNERTSS